MGFVVAGVPNVRGQSQGRLPAAPENLVAADLVERPWEFLTPKVWAVKQTTGRRVAIERDRCQAAVDGLAAVNSIFEDRASL